MRDIYGLSLASHVFTGFNLQTLLGDSMKYKQPFQSCNNKMACDFAVALSVFCACNLLQASLSYPVDDSAGLGRSFDGIGGLSGGGVRNSS